MTHRDRWRLIGLAGVLAVGAAASFTVAGLAARGDTVPGGPPQRAVGAALEPVRVGAAPVLGRSTPIQLDIAAIDVHTPVMALGLLPDGAVEVPPLDAVTAGWFTGSPTPGERGPAVLLGHVGSAHRHHGVFHDLGALRRGDVVAVGRQDGSTAVFVVDRVERYPKSAFPTAAVYGDTARPGLRLITCGGAFDPVAHRYTDNVVVYATAAP